MYIYANFFVRLSKPTFNTATYTAGTCIHSTTYALTDYTNYIECLAYHDQQLQICGQESCVHSKHNAHA